MLTGEPREKALERHKRWKIGINPWINYDQVRIPPVPG